MTLPVAVILKRFLTPLLVFILGILLPFVSDLAWRNGEAPTYTGAQVAHRAVAPINSCLPSLSWEKLCSRHGMPLRRAAQRTHNNLGLRNLQQFRLAQPRPPD